MKLKEPLRSAQLGFLLLFGLALAGCGHDPNQPATLQQQTNMARGYQPTKEQLATAMARYKAPDSGPPPATPGQGQGNGSAPGTR